jgi:hypothetical protein
MRLASLLTPLILAGLLAAEETKPDRLTFAKDIAPVVKQYCISCHSGAKPKASFSLEKIEGDGDRKTWDKVIRVLQAREMPPEDKPQPTAQERDKLLTFLDQQLAAVDCNKGRDPGRVTIRRLNRAEYNNTIRDLLAVDFSPADSFPSDDVGHGFDNIADVLTMSPLLVEKYLAAAERIVEQVLAKREGGPPIRRYVGSELKATVDAPRPPMGPNHRVLSNNGMVYVQHEFPVDGEYVIRIRAHGEQVGDFLPALAIKLNDRELKTIEVKGKDRASATEYDAKITVKKGDHRVGAAFTNEFTDEKSKQKRRLAVHYIEIQSPMSSLPPDAYSNLFIATPGDKVTKDDAAKKVLLPFLRRAFRRPATEKEVERYLKLFQLADRQGEPFDRAIGVAVSGILCSPHFLFRIEKDPEQGQAIRTLDEHELAVRLSYFLWSTMPDKELFDLAEKGELRKNLDSQVRRMLKHGKVKALTENFAAQWLQIRNLRTFTPDRTLFPDYDDRLRDDMIREVELFFGEVVREDRSILDFIDANYTYLNDRLALHYGIQYVKTSAFERVNLRYSPRGGVLTMAAVLTATSNPTRTSPVKRGKWILENILNSPPPPPPPGAGDLSEDKEVVASAPLRQRMEMHRARAECATCHARMDAMGFAFENFDAVGAWREKDGKFAIDPSGTLPGGESIKEPKDLKNILKKRSDIFARCLAEKMLTFALSRGLEYIDRCAVDDIAASLKKDDYRFSRLVLGIVQSDPFQKRKGKK